MLKVVIGFTLSGIFCSNLAIAEFISKEKCEELGGYYCPSPKVKMCYFALKEEVFSYQEATDLCAEKGAVLPTESFTDYANFLNCTKFPWKFPFSMFYQNSLPTLDKCILFTVFDVSEHTILSHCSLEVKIKVGCEVPLEDL